MIQPRSLPTSARSPRRSRLAAAAVALAAAAALLAGCSGGEESADPAVAEAPVEESSLTRDEVLDQGDAVCAEVYAAIDGLEATGASPALQASQRAELYSGMVERLRGLDADDPGLTEVFAAGRDLIAASAEAESAAEAGDAFATSEAESDVEDALAEFREAAEEYGFTDCGSEAGLSQSPTEPSGEAPVGDAGEAAPAETGGEAAEDVPPIDPAAPEGPTGGGTPEGAPVPPDDGGADPEPSGGDGGGGGGQTGGYSPG